MSEASTDKQAQTSMTTTPTKPTTPPAARLKRLLARLSAITSTLSGLDGAIMLAQYSSPLVIALLLRLARWRADGGKGMRGVAMGLAKGAAGMSEARTIMRAFGILPIIQWLLALHPKPLLALRSLLLAPLRSVSAASSSPKTLPTIQALALMVYYPLEHLGWLAGKGIVPLSAGRTGKAVLWSVRAWAVYVMLDIYKLQNQYISLSARTRAARHVQQAEGYELEADEKVGVRGKQAEAEALGKEWRTWQLASLKNLGYGPLTVHWGAGPVWTNPLITSVLGCVSASAKLVEEWDKTA